MESIIWAVIIGAVLITVFIITYLLNKNTPVPPGCEIDTKCEGCNISSCDMRKDNKEVKV